MNASVGASCMAAAAGPSSSAPTALPRALPARHAARFSASSRSVVRQPKRSRICSSSVDGAASIAYGGGGGDHSGGGGGGGGGRGNDGSEGEEDGFSINSCGWRRAAWLAVAAVAVADVCCAREAEARELDDPRGGLRLSGIATAMAGADKEARDSLAATAEAATAPAGAPRGQAPAPASHGGGAAGKALPRRIVLFVEPSPFSYTSGVQRRFLATIREMVAAGCKVRGGEGVGVLVVTPGRGAAGVLPGGQSQPTEWEGARVVEAGSFPCPGYASVPLSLGLSPRIFNEVKAHTPDLLHCTSPGALPFAAAIYSRLLGVPLVASFHTQVPTYLPKLGLGWLVGSVWGLIRATHRAAHLTIAVSPAAAADLVAAGAVDSHAVKVWPKAVDCEAFSPAHACTQMRARLECGAGAAAAAAKGPAAAAPADGDGPLLLYVGRVSKEKNIELLRPVLERVPSARLAIVGDGPAMEDVKRHFEGTPTSFLGMLKGRELSAAYASADVFVMPSESETLGNVVCEALASGLPVVAAKAGGVPSIISKPGESGGILFPPGDASAAAAAVQRLTRDPGYRRRMSQRARAEMERLSWRQATHEILNEHYPAAVAAAGTAPALAAA
eukprot:scaffold22.g6083.t1